jgi:hypothetical protein
MHFHHGISSRGFADAGFFVGALRGDAGGVEVGTVQIVLALEAVGGEAAVPTVTRSFLPMARAISGVVTMAHAAPSRRRSNRTWPSGSAISAR